MFTSYVQQIPWRRLLKFGITGGCAFAIDFAIYFALTRFGHAHYLVSRTISLSVAVIWNFTLNRYWTFEASAGKVGTQAPRFLIVIISTSIINLLLMRVGVTLLHLNDLLVIVAISLLIMLINFSAHYFWSYAKQSEEPVY